MLDRLRAEPLHRDAYPTCSNPPSSSERSNDESPSGGTSSQPAVINLRTRLVRNLAVYGANVPKRLTPEGGGDRL